MTMDAVEVGEEVLRTNDRDSSQIQSWLNGYREGNKLWPQVPTGVVLLTTAEVLNNPPDKWQIFFNSRPTETQLKRLGGAMSGYHRSAGVGYSDEAHAQESDKVVLPSRLETLWEETKNTVGRRILRFIDGYFHSVPIDAVGVQIIDNFFNDAANVEKSKKLIRIVEIAKQALLSPEGISDSDRYKEDLLSSLSSTEEKDRATTQGEGTVRGLISDKLEEEGFTEEDIYWLF